MWEIELLGDQADIAKLKELAPHYQCVIAPGRGGPECLGGIRFDGLSTVDEVRAEAAQTLKLLNGIARIGWRQFRAVQHGPISRNLPDGTYELTAQFSVEVLLPVSAHAVAERAKRIIADTILHGIAEALAGEITWQKLRVAFEKISTLIGKGDNALVSHEYATQEEITRLKANMEDPRISGLEAVHGVPRGPKPRGAKMSEQQGLEFVVRLLDTYLDRHP
jgi:hypothetical protein